MFTTFQAIVAHICWTILVKYGMLNGGQGTKPMEKIQDVFELLVWPVEVTWLPPSVSPLHCHPYLSMHSQYTCSSLLAKDLQRLTNGETSWLFFLSLSSLPENIMGSSSTPMSQCLCWTWRTLRLRPPWKKHSIYAFLIIFSPRIVSPLKWNWTMPKCQNGPQLSLALSCYPGVLCCCTHSISLLIEFQ